VDEVTCDENSYAKTLVVRFRFTGNARLIRVASLEGRADAACVRLTGNTPQKGANNIASARRTAIHLTGIIF